MERKIYLLIVIDVFMFANVLGQSNRSIYQAYIKGDMTKWEYTMDSIEASPEITNEDKLELLNYQYGYVAWCIGNERKNEAEQYIEKSEKLIQFLEEIEYELSVLFAYKAAFVGFEIGISPYKAPFIGSESLNYAKQSIDIDSFNSLGYTQLANISFYTPKILGGSEEEALQYYLKALKLMERKANNTDHNWNYLNLLAAIINAYIELEDYEMAKKYCEKTLFLEPNFDWVKNKLYPQVLKQMQNKEKSMNT